MQWLQNSVYLILDLLHVDIGLLLQYTTVGSGVSTTLKLLYFGTSSSDSSKIITRLYNNYPAEALNSLWILFGYVIFLSMTYIVCLGLVMVSQMYVS